MDELTFEEWKRLIMSSDNSDRALAADELPKGPRKEIVRLLVKCLKDPYALVRTCAADTLGALPGKAARDALRAAVDREQDDLARAYVLSSLGAVGTFDDIGRLAEALRTATNAQVRLHAALGLAFCALGESMVHLLTFVKQDGNIQAASANCLGEYLNTHKAYVKVIRDTVKRQIRRKDLMVSEKEALGDLLAEIEEAYKI